MNDVYVLNDPKKRSVVAHNNGTGGVEDYMNFLVTDTYYYNVDGKRRSFQSKVKRRPQRWRIPHQLQSVGWEGAKAINGTHVEINGSTVSYTRIMVMFALKTTTANEMWASLGYI